jgi:RimJ/RimL family protein N-acetyltransferase
MNETLPIKSLRREIAASSELRLRLAEPADGEAMFRIIQEDPEIQAYISWTAEVKSVKDVERKIEEFQQKREIAYTLLEDQNVIGYVGLRANPQGPEDEYEIAYFCARASRGQGHVSNAVASLMTAITESTPVSAFTLYINEVNSASQAVAARLGFARTDELREDKALNRSERRYEKLI